MHYYKRNIGDYHKKAGRLTMLQHGAYTLLMDAIYDREKFPTAEEAIDWCWASTQDEIDAVLFVLRKFFIETRDGCVQNRIQEELDEYHELCEKNAENGKKGGRPKGSKNNPKKPTGNPEETQSVNKKTQPVVLETQSKPKESDPNPNHEPLTTNHEPSKNIPYQLIVDKYHECCTNLPQVKILTDKRKTKIRTFWNAKEKHQDIGFYEKYFTFVNQQDFLIGNVGVNGERQKAWKADLEWLMNINNLAKVIEGKYDND